MSDPQFIEEELPDTMVTVVLVDGPGSSTKLLVNLNDAIGLAFLYHTRDLSQPQTAVIRTAHGVTVLSLDAINMISIQHADHRLHKKMLQSIEGTSNP